VNAAALRDHDSHAFPWRENSIWCREGKHEKSGEGGGILYLMENAEILGNFFNLKSVFFFVKKKLKKWTENTSGKEIGCGQGS
jgi:hypothetical protein